ncbi:MAG: hypothetical protein JXJ04_25160 [Spirochaetales bacterium]|nr:hypothetical protein [Spirochaetales bacterium]
MSLKSVTLNITTSGTFDSLLIEDRSRLIFLNSLIIISDLILLVFSFSALKEMNMVLLIANSSAFTFILFLFIFLRSTKLITPTSHAFCVVGFLLFLYLGISGGSDNSGVLWILSYPLITIFLLRLRVGSVYSVLFICAVALFIIMPQLPSAAYSFSFKMRIIGSYILMLGFSIMYELTRETMHKKIEQTSLDLLNEKKQRDNLFNNVREGIFLLDKNLKVNENYSKALEDILSQSEPGNKNFLEILKDRVPKKMISTTEDYFNMFFDPGKDDELLEEINPLKRVEYNVLKKNGNFKTKQLEFSVNRISDEKGNIYILSTVRDITEAVELSQKLKKAKDETERQMETIFQVINVNPVLLDDFIAETEVEIKKINKILKSDNKNHAKIFANIYQSIHAIKGNAILLGLNNFVKKLHTIEDEINTLNKKNIVYNDILKLIIKLSGVQSEIANIKESIKKVLSFQASRKSGDQNKRDLFISAIKRVVETTSSALKKEAILDTDNFDCTLISDNNMKVMKDVFIQLARNAVSHGIESPKERIKKKKEKSGKIYLSSSRKGENIEFKFGDDGKGIDMERIREKAKSHKGIALSDVDNFDEKQLIRLIFHPGFSTADNPNISFGRGVGMNVVLSKVKSIGGKIKIKTSMDKGSEFTIIIPDTNTKMNIQKG